MKTVRYFTLVSLFVVPFFILAQTSTPADTLQKQIDSLVMDRMGSLPTPDQIRSNGIRDNLQTRINPQNPGPGENVQMSIESFLTDLDKATITWTLNGKVAEKGMGKSSFTFKNGTSGTTTHLSIFIITNTGDQVTKEFLFRPVGVAILWEADTYTPPFYKGKALMTAEARMRAVVIPNTPNSQNALDAGNLAYVWKKNGDIVDGTSGYGKNSLSFNAPIPLTETEIGVVASSVDDSIKSEINISIPLVRPFVLFYEDHPLIGIWYNRSLGTSIELSKKEFSITATPFFFSNEHDGSSNTVYNWSLNNNTLSNIKRSITLRNKEGSVGDSSITLAMRNIFQTFQTASQSITIHFTAGVPEASPQPTL